MLRRYDAPTDLFELTFRQHVICNQILARTVVPGMKEAGYGELLILFQHQLKRRWQDWEFPTRFAWQ